MTVTTPVTFFGALGPVLGTFTQALDSNGVWTGMTQFGNWSLPGAPQSRLGPMISSFSATTTAGNVATYTIVSSHTGGASQLSMITLLASASITGAPACQLVYFPGANTLNLVNDAGTDLVAPGGVVLGQPGLLANSRCSANSAGASHAVSGNTLTWTVPVTYSSSFAGQKSVYANAFDINGLLGHWVQGSTMQVQ